MDLGHIIANLLPGAATTLIVATGAWVFGAIFGLFVDIGRSISPGPLGWASDLIITTLRSLPQLVVIYIFFFGLGALGIDLGSIPSAIIALGLTEAAFTAEYYRAGWLTVPEQQNEAGLSLGLSRLQVFRRVVVPQTVPFLVPPLLNSYVGLLKTATLASAVGAPEILYLARNLISNTGLLVPVALTVILLYVVVTLPLTYAVSLLEKRARSFRRVRAG
jgi:His/Glu/Gln/Arg/opine family amino acid ABC transporter permease subunit